MFDNPNEELKKLESQLLAVEETGSGGDDDFEAFYQDILKEFGPGTEPRKKAASTKKTTQKAPQKNTYSDRPTKKAKKKKGIKGLVITLCLEVMGIVAIILWWILRIL